LLMGNLQPLDLPAFFVYLEVSSPVQAHGPFGILPTDQEQSI
jgi:hypothetical protein